MPSLTRRVQSFLKSPQGRKAIGDQGERLAKDPATRRKLDDPRKRLFARSSR